MHFENSYLTFFLLTWSVLHAVHTKGANIIDAAVHNKTDVLVVFSCIGTTTIE